MLEVKKYTVEGMLKEKGYYVYTSVGVSMMPFLRERRDIIEIRPNNERIRKYQVALYKKSGLYILHRCISVTPDGYVFAGDHNCLKEYDVKDDMILGVMTRVIRDGKPLDLNGIRYKLYCFFIVNLYPLKCFALWLLRKMKAIIT